ncbi:phage tail tape measure protein [Planktosalinus lacus]|uniref:Bacteriophage tail tape measure N-terminal domain-containing protein n=1 Tax=Planktosalinus lacus TaxID=1526573 RepID=A0A8J2Y8F5_9FLAO|nr:phage tail tape measure protein [Planktosalinus lacus]GGD85863.1 hypothetical protein GCM10011312_07360 [Planktosalinus lacus]
MASFADISIRFRADLKQFRTEMEHAQFQVKKFGKKMTSVGKGLSVGITLPVVALGAAAVKSASDAEETSSKFNTVFKDISAAAQNSASVLRESFGLSSQASKQLLGDTGDLLTGFGFSQKAALELSTEVNKLAVDLASFTNFSGGAAGASAALTKALLGERESVKSLGISILEADVKAKVLQNTQEGLTFETERQAKAFATLQLAQEQSKNAIGDYERTSKSFANQARLLRARIQDVSAQFGEVLLPYFSEGITKVTDLVKRFGNLDQSTKKIIVVVAAFAAALGPVLISIGFLATNVIPGLISALTALKVAMATNPIGLLAVALGAVAGAMILFRENTEKAAKAQTSLRSLTAQASKSIAEEKAQLERLLFVARDEKVSKEERVKAIKELNRISPKYLGFLNTENINTDKARKAVEKYTAALLENARAKAAEEKLIEVQRKMIENELALSSRRQKIAEEEQKSTQIAADNASSAALAQTQLGQAKQLLTADTENLNKKLKEEEQLLLGIIAGTQKLAETTVTPTNNGEGERGNSQPVSQLEPFDTNGIAATTQQLQEQIAVFENMRSQFAEGGAEYDYLTQRINFLNESLGELQNNDAGPLLPDTLSDTEALESFNRKMEETRQLGISVGESVAGAFENFTGRFVDSLGLAKDGFEGFMGSLIQTVSKIISALLAQAIAQAISGANTSAGSTGPGYMFTAPTFIATAIGGILSAFASIPKFADGGIVSAPTLGLIGEYSGASTNPEVIAPLSKLKSMLGDVGGQVFIPNTVLRGEDIVISYERTTTRNNRLR